MGHDLALDFGSATTRVVDQAGVSLFEEPTIAAVDDDRGRLLAFGTKALEMGKSSAGRVVITRPVRGGQLVDLSLAEEVLGGVLSAVGTSRFSRPRILVCLHVNETNIQRRAIERALKKGGARQVLFVEQPIACAVGADLSIDEPEASMAIDVGAGTADVGILALGGVVTAAAVPIGGDDFDEAIRDYVVRRHGTSIDRETAEGIKRSIGTIGRNRADQAVEVTGRTISSGEVRTAVISSNEILPLLEEATAPIFHAAVRCITDAPPDLGNDLLGLGLVLGGGGSLLDGFDERLSEVVGIEVHRSPRAGSLAVFGAARCLSMFDAIASLISPAHR